MASWFRRRGSLTHLDQLNPIPPNQEISNPSSPSHNNTDNNSNIHHRQRARSDFNGAANPIYNNLSQYHYMITTLIPDESFHIFSSSNIQDIKTEILKTVVYQSAFGPEIENLNWDLYYQNTKLTNNSQIHAFINQQLTQNKQTMQLQMKIIHDQKYDNWLNQCKRNNIRSPQINKITYTDFSCNLHIDCGWNEPVIHAYNVQYQLVLMECPSDCDVDQVKIHTSDNNSMINIKDIWPWLGYKCRVRLIHRLFDIKSNWSKWTENISVSTKPLDINMNDEKKQSDIHFNIYNNGDNIVSFFESMDHEQLKQWTQFKLFGNVTNPLLVYDDEKNPEITRRLNSNMWSTYIEKESGLLSLVQFAISESKLNGNEFLFHDPEEFINQLLPQELVDSSNGNYIQIKDKPKLSHYASSPVVLNQQNQGYLHKKKSIKEGGYGREDYLSVLWRLRELAFVEGNNVRYSMGIPCYNPYTIFIWMYFLKIPKNQYALYCRETQSYILLKYFCSENNNECHLFLGKYYIRKQAEVVNVSFELHEMVKMNGFGDDGVNLTQSKPVLLSGDKKNNQIIMIYTMNKQHVIARCYNQARKNEDIITKYKVIEDWVNFFVSRWKVHGCNLPYFECILKGIFSKIGDQISLTPAIDVMHLIYFWHSKNEKNKQKIIMLTKEKLKNDALVWAKPDISSRKEIVQFLFYIWWIIGGSNNEKPALFDSSSITMHKIQQVLFGKFGSLDRVFPLLRTIFYGKSQQYMDKIEKSLTKSYNSLNIRMQLLLWYNFMNAVTNKQQINAKHQNTNIKIKNNIKSMELTPNLIQMIQIDVELEQQTTIQRAYALESDAFYALRINSSKNDEYSVTPSKYIEKLICLLLIFKPNYHFIINQYKMDIIQILKREMNPMQCLHVMHNILNINGTQNQEVFSSLMDPFVPRISTDSPLCLQTHFQQLLKEHNPKNVIGFEMEEKNVYRNNESMNFEIIAVKHRFSILNKQNSELKQQLSEYKSILQTIHNEEQNNNKMKAEINEILNENDELKQMLKQNQVDFDKNSKNNMNTIELLTKQNMQTQTQLNLQKKSYDEIDEKLSMSQNECTQIRNELDAKNKEIEKLEREISDVKELENDIDTSPMVANEINDKNKRFRPFLFSITDEVIEEKAKEVEIVDEKKVEIDSEALKIELLNYMKFSATHTISKKYLPLTQFHPVASQILLDWKFIKSQTYDNVIEQFMDFMDESNIEKYEITVYNLCYELIMQCYEFMNEQQHKCNPMVFNMIYLNLETFYELKINNKIVEMLRNVFNFLDLIIDSICHSVCKKYEFMNEINKELKECINKLIMDCCSTTWSLIHYKYFIGPNMIDINEHKVFDDKIHKKENEGENITCFVFPGVCHMECNNLILYETDIWVLCDE